MESNEMTNGASKKIRAPGELQAIIAEVLKRRPAATPDEVAEKVGISRANARMSMKRYKKNNGIKEVKAMTKAKTKSKKSAKLPSVSPGSAVARLFGGKEPERTSVEKKFVALIAFVGVDRAFVLLKEETQRLGVVCSQVPDWLLLMTGKQP